MFQGTQFALFFGATLTLLLIPGAAVLYIVAQSLERGGRFGVASAAGIFLGGCLHVAASLVGLSALLASSALAFSALKYLGAGYLIYLGLTKFFEKTPAPDAAVPARASARLRDVFWQGAIVQILNPKVALFFLSFLPQFVDPASPRVTEQFAILGTAFVVLAFLTDSAYALVAGRVGRPLIARMKGAGLSRWFAGLTYLTLGILTAVTGQKKTS